MGDSRFISKTLATIQTKETPMTKQEIAKKRKELLALGKDPKFVEMLLKGATKAKRMF